MNEVSKMPLLWRGRKEGRLLMGGVKGKEDGGNIDGRIGSLQ